MDAIYTLSKKAYVTACHHTQYNCVQKVSSKFAILRVIIFSLKCIQLYNIAHKLLKSKFDLSVIIWKQTFIVNDYNFAEKSLN